MITHRLWQRRIVLPAGVALAGIVVGGAFLMSGPSTSVDVATAPAAAAMEAQPAIPSPERAPAPPVETVQADEAALPTAPARKAGRPQSAASAEAEGEAAALEAAELRLAPLPADDARWGVGEEAPRLEDEALSERLDTASAEAAAAPGSTPSAQTADVDLATTSSVPPERQPPADDAEALPALADGSDGPVAVQVAETPDQIAALEAAAAREQLGADDRAFAAEVDALRDARVTKWVNFRAGPGNDAEIIKVVPADAAVRAADECIHFCEVVVDGQSGFIYKGFIRYTEDEVAGAE